MAEEKQQSNKKIDLTEVAHVKNQPFNYHFNNLLTSEDQVMMQSNKNYKSYDKLELDSTVKIALNKRKMALSSREWQVESASDDTKDQQIGEFVYNVLKEIDLNSKVVKFADAILKGFVPAEILWQSSENGITIDDIKVRHQDRFLFDTDGNLKLKTKQNFLNGEEVPGNKFIVHSYGDKYDNPYGVGLGQNLYWLVYFKNQDLQFWLKFLEKFGNPTAIGEYENETSKTALEEAVRGVQNDTGVVIPKGSVLRLLDNDAKNSTDSYKVLIDYFDKQILQLILGETLTTDVGDSGSYAAGSVHNDVRIELVKSDLKQIAATLNNTVVKWLVDYNFTNIKKYPKLKWIVEEKENLNARADRDKKIYEMGYKPTDEYIKNTYGEGFEAITNNLEPTNDFSEPTTKKSEQDQVTDLAVEQTDKVAQTMFDRLKHIVKTSADFEQVNQRVELEFKNISDTDFANIMQDAMVLSDLLGQESAELDIKG